MSHPIGHALRHQDGIPKLVDSSQINLRAPVPDSPTAAHSFRFLSMVELAADRCWSMRSVILHRHLANSGGGRSSTESTPFGEFYQRSVNQTGAVLGQADDVTGRPLCANARSQPSPVGCTLLETRTNGTDSQVQRDRLFGLEKCASYRWRIIPFCSRIYFACQLYDE